jgi:hypothetical protein
VTRSWGRRTDREFARLRAPDQEAFFRDVETYKESKEVPPNTGHNDINSQKERR